MQSKRVNKDNAHNISDLADMANLIRIKCIEMTNKANSGHPTSCSSSADFITCLFFDEAGMQFDPKHPEAFENDRLVFSKGHAAPLLYAAWNKVGYLEDKELLTLREFHSRLEGHPTTLLPFVDVATGSLGQGIGVAAGMAYSSKYLDKIDNKYFVLCGDAELAEGNIWESVNFASHYKLDNLVVFVDVNSFGQSNVLGHQMDIYKARFSSFGWEAKVIDGHNVSEILDALEEARNIKNKPFVIIGKTSKGKNFGEGVDNTMSFHGKPLGAYAEKAIAHLKTLIKNPNVQLKPTLPKIGKIPIPEVVKVVLPADLEYKKGDKIATRQAYGKALTRLGGKNNKGVIALDADLKNSTFSEEYKKKFPEQFVECFISEQNMITVAMGLHCRKKIAIASTFACFASRCYDQLRMAAISNSSISFCGSHCGTNIGEDGLTAMSLEDIAIFRALKDSVVLYPSDAVSCEKAVEIALNNPNIAYIRTARNPTEVIYDSHEKFELGKCKVVQKSDKDELLVVTCGITLYEAFNATKLVNKKIRIIDLFSVKPIDRQGLIDNAIHCNKKILTIEDHYQAGGIYEAVCGALADQDIKVYGIYVDKTPKSGKSQDVMEFVGITAKPIAQKIISLL